MQTSSRISTLAAVIAVGVFYAAVGVLFAQFEPVILWRRLAWAVSAVAFAAHIAFEHFVRGSTTGRLAGCVSGAAAIGPVGLAAAANLRGWSIATANHRALAVALIAWPLLVAIPAFLLAISSRPLPREFGPARMRNEPRAPASTPGYATARL